jgi:hypothetical protein
MGCGAPVSAEIIEYKDRAIYRDGSIVLKEPLRVGTEWEDVAYGSCKGLARIVSVTDERIEVDMVSSCNGLEKRMCTVTWKRDRGPFNFR